MYVLYKIIKFLGDEYYIVELQIYYEECIQNGRVKTYPLGKKRCL